MEWGGFLVVGHGVDRQLQDQMLDYARKFFLLPPEMKDRVHLRHGGAAWRGYMPFGGEMSQSGQVTDFKEGLYLGKEFEATHPFVVAKYPNFGVNLLPAELPGWRDVLNDYIAQLTKLGDTMMSLISKALSLQEDFISSNVTLDDPVVLPRIFHYPAQTNKENVNDERWGIGDHTDYGLWTMILTNAPGLEVIHPKTNQMVAVPYIANSFFMNAGDVLDRLTRGIYKSPLHRARNIGNESRISIPFFYDPGWTARMKHFPVEPNHSIEEAASIKKRWDATKIRCNFDGSVEYSELLAKKVAKVFPDLVPQKLMENLDSTSSPSTRHAIVIDVPEKHHQATLINEIEDDRQQVLRHNIYNIMAENHDNGMKDSLNQKIATFMEHHVWAVYDYFQLLKRLQRHFTCVELPWRPTKDPKMRHFITEIVAEEECDEAEDGVTHISHLELYVRSMEKLGANTKPINQFLAALDDYDDMLSFESWFEEILIKSGAPKASQEHVKMTMDLARNGSICEVAAVFTFGREDIIPKMFIRILNNHNLASSEEFSIFRYYLQRHIDLDGKDHGPHAIALVNGVCGDDPEKWKQATDAVKKALKARTELWSAVEKLI